MRKNHRVTIVEPSPLMIAGLQSLLTKESEIEITLIQDGPMDSISKITASKPDVVIFSPSLLDHGHRLMIRNAIILNEEVAMVALHHTYVESSVLKQFDAVIELQDSAQTIAQKIKNAIEAKKDNADQNQNYSLSDREIEILISVAKGKSNKEIADEHNISINTVISHRKNISRKTGIKSVSGFTVYAMLNNLIDQADVE